MHATVRLVDPHGLTQATLQAPATPEALLRAAFDLGAQDALVVCLVGQAEWSLAIYRAGPGATVEPIGPAIAEVSRSRWDSMRRAMLEMAWLDLVDAGWGVVVTDGQPATRSMT